MGKSKTPAAPRDPNVCMVNIRMRPVQKAVFREAAKRCGKTLGAYVRDDLIVHAAAFAGIQIPRFAPFERGSASQVSVAARKLGMSTSEYRKFVVAEAVKNANAAPLQVENSEA